MRKTTQSCLQAMMNDYARAVAKRTGGPTDEQIGQRMFDRLGEDFIRPLMSEFAKTLETNGHSCRVYSKPISVSTPGNVTQNAEIVMNVYPNMEDEDSDLDRLEYQISFSLAPEKQKLLATVRHGSRHEPCSACPNDFHPLDGVTAELVEAELLEMMRHVFAESERGFSL